MKSKKIVIGKSIIAELEYPRKEREDQKTCSPYEYCGVNKHPVSNSPFEIGENFSADFHSPVLTLNWSSFGHDGTRASGGAGETLIYIEREKMPLILNLFGEDLDKSIDARDPSIREKVSEIFFGGFSYLEYKGPDYYPKVDGKEILPRLLSNKFASGDNQSLGSGEEYTSTLLKCKEIAFYSKDFSEHYLDSSDTPYGLVSNWIDTGFITIGQEDYIKLGKPERVYLRSLSVGLEERFRKRIRQEVKRSLEILSQERSKEEFDGLVNAEFDKILKKYTIGKERGYDAIKLE